MSKTGTEVANERTNERTVHGTLGQLNIYGQDKVDVAIERIRTFEPPEGYYVAFSGGKDSSVILELVKMAGVKFDAHYTLTSVDPPELVQFIKHEHPEVIIDIPKYPEDYKNPRLAGKQITMWNLIPEKKMPPTRIVRYCCSELKESRGEGRFVVTGVRWQESTKRSKRGGVEFAKKKSHRMENYDPDNPSQEMIHQCMKWARRHLNPIIDWTTDDVWEFIYKYNVPYCCLYDQGYHRLGCIGCPMGSVQQRLREFERYPKYKQAYIRAFDRMIEERNKVAYENYRKSGEELMESYEQGQFTPAHIDRHVLDRDRTGTKVATNQPTNQPTKDCQWEDRKERSVAGGQDRRRGGRMVGYGKEKKWDVNTTNEEIFKWWIR